MSRVTARFTAIKNIDYSGVLGEQRVRVKRDVRDARFFYLAVAVVGIVFAVAFVYLWSRVTVTQLGYDISKANGERGALIEKNKRLKLELTGLKSPERLASEARALGLDYPNGERIVRVK
jgi:cell division protein FtsL